MTVRNKKPPFEITNTILDEIAEIAELVGYHSYSGFWKAYGAYQQQEKA